MQKEKIKKYQKVIYSVILGIGLLWCGGIITAPLLADSNGVTGKISETLYSFYSKSCHQLDERSFHIHEHKFGVCSRCTSIYFAFLFGTIIYPFVRRLSNIELPSIWLLFIPAGLLLIDVGLDIADVFKNTFITREITGAIIGSVLPFFIIPGTIRVFHEFFLPPKVKPISTDDGSK